MSIGTEEGLLALKNAVNRSKRDGSLNIICRCSVEKSCSDRVASEYCVGPTSGGATRSNDPGSMSSSPRGSR